MDNPVKLNWVITVRKRIDSLIKPVPLPNINPNIISFASVLSVAIILIFHSNLYWIFFFVFLSIMFDWFDGIVARRYNTVSRQGYLVDSFCDRASEGILAIAFFYPWFYLFILNLFLWLFSWKTKVNLLLPLRLFFLIIILFEILGINWGWI